MILIIRIQSPMERFQLATGCNTRIVCPRKLTTLSGRTCRLQPRQWYGRQKKKIAEILTSAADSCNSVTACPNEAKTGAKQDDRLGQELDSLATQAKRHYHLFRKRFSAISLLHQPKCYWLVVCDLVERWATRTKIEGLWLGHRHCGFAVGWAKIKLEHRWQSRGIDACSHHRERACAITFGPRTPVTGNEEMGSPEGGMKGAQSDSGWLMHASADHSHPNPSLSTHSQDSSLHCVPGRNHTFRLGARASCPGTDILVPLEDPAATCVMELTRLVGSSFVSICLDDHANVPGAASPPNSLGPILELGIRPMLAFGSIHDASIRPLLPTCRSPATGQNSGLLYPRQFDSPRRLR